MRKLLLLAALLGCGDSTGGSQASGAFSVDVTSAELRASVGKLTPKSGRTFVVLEVSIHNSGESEAILANGALFSVLTEGAISAPISAALAALPSPCVDLSVAKGGHLSCGLAFEIPSDDPPAKLVYDDKQGHSSTTKIPEPTTVCPAEDWSSSSCKSCVGQALFTCGFPPEGCSVDEENCFLGKIQSSSAALCTAPQACTKVSKCVEGLNKEAECFIASCAAKCL